MSQENVEIVRRAGAAFESGLERGEVEAFVREFYDPEGQYEPIEEAAPLRGHDAIIEYFRRMLEVWEEFHLELEEVIDAGDQVVSTALLRGRSKSSRIEVSQRIYSVTEVRDLKILHNCEFLNHSEALEASGLSD
jgi:ketosteroid isomerase-like protein